MSNLTLKNGLYLVNNNFRCDCELIELIEWFGDWAIGKLKDWSTTICNNENTFNELPIAFIRYDGEGPCYEPYNVKILNL